MVIGASYCVILGVLHIQSWNHWIACLGHEREFFSPHTPTPQHHHFQQSHYTKHQCPAPVSPLCIALRCPSQGGVLLVPFNAVLNPRQHCLLPPLEFSRPWNLSSTYHFGFCASFLGSAKIFLSGLFPALSFSYFFLYLSTLLCNWSRGCVKTTLLWFLDHLYLIMNAHLISRPNWKVDCSWPARILPCLSRAQQLQMELSFFLAATLFVTWIEFVFS